MSFARWLWIGGKAAGQEFVEHWRAMVFLLLAVPGGLLVGPFIFVGTMLWLSSKGVPDGGAMALGALTWLLSAAYGFYCLDQYAETHDV